MSRNLSPSSSAEGFSAQAAGISVCAWAGAATNPPSESPASRQARSRPEAGARRTRRARDGEEGASGPAPGGAGLLEGGTGAPAGRGLRGPCQPRGLDAGGVGAHRPDAARLSALGSRLSALGSRLSALGSRLSALGSRLSALGSRLLLTGLPGLHLPPSPSPNIADTLVKIVYTYARPPRDCPPRRCAMVRTTKVNDGKIVVNCV